MKLGLDARPGRVGPRRLIHAAGLDPGPALQPLQTRHLLAQGDVVLPQHHVLLQQSKNQLLEVLKVEAINI